MVKKTVAQKKASPKKKAEPKKKAAPKKKATTAAAASKKVAPSKAASKKEAVDDKDRAPGSAAKPKVVKKKSSLKIKSEAPEVPTSQDDYPVAYGPMAGTAKIVSWNFNGINACIKNGASDYLTKESPTVLCVQETKANDVDSDKWWKALGGKERWPHAYFSCADAKGRHGTAVLSTVKPVRVYYGLDDDDAHEPEGRVIIVEFAHFLLVNTYVVNSGMKLERLEYRVEWDGRLRARMQRLAASTGKPLVWTGDLNVAHTDWDLALPDSRRDKVPGAHSDERASFAQTLADLDLVDLWREQHSEPRDQHFTFWSYKFQARAKNNGWRIDYFAVSRKLAAQLGDVFIRSNVVGSDHVPLGLLLPAKLL